MVFDARTLLRRSHWGRKRWIASPRFCASIFRRSSATRMEALLLVGAVPLAAIAAAGCPAGVAWLPLAAPPPDAQATMVAAVAAAIRSRNAVTCWVFVMFAPSPFSDRSGI